MVRKPLVIALCCWFLAGCGSTPAHSAYFIVTFVPGTVEPSVQGRQALANAVREAGRPGFALVTALAPPNDPAALELARRRSDGIAERLVKAGIDGTVVSTEIETVDAHAFALRKDDLVIQFGYGVKRPD